MKKFKRIIIVIAVVLAVGAASFAGLRYYQGQKDAEDAATQTKTEIVEQRFEVAARLETADCISTYIDRYENSVNMKKDLHLPFNANIPLTKKSFIVSYVGTVSAGIDDLTQAKIEETADGAIKVTLPKITVFETTVDNDSIEIIEENNNAVNKLSIEDFNDSIIRVKEKIKKQAIENGLEEKARTNAETLIRGLLGDLSQNIIIEWEK